MKKNKKAQIEGLQGLIIPLVAIGIVLVVGLLIVDEVRDQVEDTQEDTFCQGILSFNTSSHNCMNASGTDHTSATVNFTAAWNASNEVKTSIDSVAPWLPIFVITIIGALLIGLVSYFRSR